MTLYADDIARIQSMIDASKTDTSPLEKRVDKLEKAAKAATEKKAAKPKK